MSASSLEFGPTLPQLAVLGVGGADALEFMQGQLSQDLRELADGSTRLAALHTPQGRVVATMWLRQAADGRILTLLPASLAETVTARLRRYVLRSRVSIEPLADWTLRESLHPTAAHAPSGCVFELPDGRRLQAAPGPAAAADPAPSAHTPIGCVAISQRACRCWGPRAASSSSRRC
jgi:hypothetical protein